jgi:hypothetical protein
MVAISTQGDVMGTPASIGLRGVQCSDRHSTLLILIEVLSRGCPPRALRMCKNTSEPLVSDQVSVIYHGVYLPRACGAAPASISSSGVSGQDTGLGLNEVPTVVCPVLVAFDGRLAVRVVLEEGL